MLRKICSVFMALLVALFCLPVSSLAAESDLQSDFDQGLMTLTTGFAYQSKGLYYIISSIKNTSNGSSSNSDVTYTFNSSLNPEYKFAHCFDIQYTDNRVLMSQGDNLTFSIHNFSSSFYFGNPSNFDVSRYFWLDILKSTGFFMYFIDFSGNSHLVSSSMYDISFNQDDAMITVQMKSDMYDLDVYRIRLYLVFDINSLYNSSSGLYCSPSWVNNYGYFNCSYGYSNLFFEISSEDQATTGLLTSIIDYIKEMWNSIKNLPANIKTSLSSLFDKITSGLTNLGTSISGFFDSLKSKLTSLFKGVTDGISNLFGVMTEEQTTYAPIDEGELPSDYQDAEDEAFDSAGVGDLDSNIDDAFKDANSVFSNNNAYAFISGSMEHIVFGNVKISGLVIFSLAMGLCVLVLGRKLNSA